MWCGKIRMGSGEWHRPRQPAGARCEYTHGICPECEKKMSDELQNHLTS